jgi:hypothetical protein
MVNNQSIVNRSHVTNLSRQAHKPMRPSKIQPLKLLENQAPSRVPIPPSMPIQLYPLRAFDSASENLHFTTQNDIMEDISNEMDQTPQKQVQLS